ncbi:MAG: DUF805 domain-containing protein [Demequinaceae bacterium]|nr:DUF805 domain-containing protein [Demequinaceae bacterium]
MGFGEAFGTCMRKYANFSDRARRSEYWWFYLAVILITFPFVIAFGLAFLPAAEDLIDLLEDQETPTAQQVIDLVQWDQLVGPGLLLAGVWLLFFLPMLAVTVRRLHDIGLSGWLYLVVFVPFGLGSAAMLVMCVIDGQAKENRWGPDPKADERPLWGQVREAPPPLGG